MSGALRTRLLVGVYTETSGGHGTGIAVVEPSASAAPTASTVAVLDDPSFIAVSDDRLYAVSETDAGTVHAFARDGAALEHLWDAPSGGDAPCHIRVDPAGALVIANYVSGTVGVVGLAIAEAHGASLRDGDAATHEHGEELRSTVPERACAVHALPDGAGPVADRQAGPHAHQSVPAPGGLVLVSDLGADALHEIRVVTGEDGAPAIEPVRVHRLDPGTGPRHMAWLDGDLLVAGELDGRVHRLRPDEHGAMREVASAPLTDGSDGLVQPSHLDVGEDGRVYAAVRGQDTIVVLDGAAGGLSFVAAVPCGGAWPRHFLLVDGCVVVANERSDELTVLPIDADGVPGQVAERVRVGSPTCVVPID